MKNSELSRREKLLTRLDSFMDVALKLPDEMRAYSSLEEYMSEESDVDFVELSDEQWFGFESDYRRYVEYATAYNTAVKKLYYSLYDIVGDEIGSA